MNVLISEGIYDKDYIEKYASGFPELAAHVREFTPEWAEPITEIPAQMIRETARAMGEAKPAVALASRTARDLVRRRHAARARHGHPDRADRKLGPQGRHLPADADQDRQVRAAAVSRRASAAARTAPARASRWPRKSRASPTA